VTIFGLCQDCGATRVVPVDDGEIIWVECGTCGKTTTAWARDEAPSMLLYAAEKVSDD
jgi:hypothetical protein